MSHYEMPKIKMQIKNEQVNEIPKGFARIENPPGIPRGTVFAHENYPSLRIIIHNNNFRVQYDEVKHLAGKYTGSNIFS